MDAPQPDPAVAPNEPHALFSVAPGGCICETGLLTAVRSEGAYAPRGVGCQIGPGLRVRPFRYAALVAAVRSFIRLEPPSVARLSG